ncbi:aminotransferase class IV [Rariglobus hedericola]|uniref:branched-chain-amino-acid transaminase n=1 Tax=Rariglobus hedericola TaxID=2597822 RepID=A0A556QQT6_9BACT|nr:aminotransferase class IV [Rariglobus hedericola]TSJ78989.1 aminotransferase class IV [Rariglobus hedericola]
MPPAHFIQANTNGRLHSADEPSIAPLNRGFLYGDAIYEVWRTYNGVVFAWDEHWQRLERSAASLYMTLRWSQEQMLAEVKKTVAAWRTKTGGDAVELYIRLQITRGGGAIGLDVALSDGEDFVLLVQPCPLLTAEVEAKGITLSLARTLHRNHPGTLNPAWKTGNYLNNLLCLREARSRGADEVVITNLAGQITEAAVSNIGFVRDGELVLPPVEAGILEGITRRILIDHLAPAVGVTVREQTVRPEDLAGMQECFLTATTKDIVPVHAIDDVVFTTGADTLTLRLKTAFAAYVAAYIEERPQQLV